MVKTITNELFEQHKSNGDFFIMDFYADWCGKCDEMFPMVEELALEFPDIPFYKVNIDDFPNIKEKARIKAIPMLTIYREGHMRDFAFGVIPKEKITKKINHALGIIQEVV